jgi:hypothetical protein
LRCHENIHTTPLEIKDGYFELTTAPGLGTDLDESVIAERTFNPDDDRTLGNAGSGSGSWNAEDMSPADV